MTNEGALPELVKLLTVAVSSASSASDAAMAAESEAGEALDAARAYGRESDILEAEALKSATGEQAGVLADLAKTAEELLQRAVALMGSTASAPTSSGGIAHHASAHVDAVATIGASGAIERRAAQAPEAFEAGDNAERQRPRIKPMTSLLAGGGVASTIMTAGGTFLPAYIQIPLATAATAVGSLPAIKDFGTQVRDVFKDRMARRRKKASSED